MSDTGVGITPADLPDIFDMFYVPGGTPAGRTDRPGVGLTAVRELGAAHAGTVSGSSAGNGRGSQFVVTLPLHDPTAPDVASSGT